MNEKNITISTKGADKVTRRLTKEITTELISLLNGRVAIIPQAICPCGKPIVFTNNRKTFTCSKCGGKWELFLEIKKIKNF